MTKKFLDYVFLTLLYATFLVPIIVIPSSFIFPFIVPKIVIFRSLAAALVAVFILLYKTRPAEFRLRATPLTLAVLAFAGSFVLSTFLGTDAYHSFWDNHERMLGLFTILHYAAYYLAVTSVLKTWTDWKWALRLFLFAGTIVTTVGLLEAYNPEILTHILPVQVANILIQEAGGRVSSLLGNAIYLGGYGLFLLAISAVLVIREQLIAWRITTVICGIIAFGAMGVSGTRGSFLGLFAGVLSAIALLVYVNRNNKILRNSALGLLVLILMFLGLGYVFRQSPFVANIPMVGRILNSSLGSGTGSTRLIAWTIAVKSWYQRPIFGWGPNNFFYAFNQYYNPISLRFGFGETWFDNAHNVLLNTLTVQGIIGLVTYLGIFVCAWWMLFKNKVWRDKHPDIFIIGAAFLVAHLVQNLTVFENPTSYLFFMFWLAFINAQTVPVAESVVLAVPLVKKRGAETSHDRPLSLLVAITVVGLAAIFIYLFNYEPARANQNTLLVLQHFDGKNPELIAEVNNILSDRSPHIDDIRSDIARSAISVLSNYQSLDPAFNKQLIDVVYPAVQANIALHPLDIRNQLNLAQLGQMAYEVTKNPQYIFEAEKVLSDALVASPRRQQIIYSLSGIKAQLGKKDEAIKLLASTVTDAPSIGENYWRLAFLYQYLGEMQKAHDVLQAAHNQGIDFTDQALQQEAQINAALLKAGGTKP